MEKITFILWKGNKFVLWYSLHSTEITTLYFSAVTTTPPPMSVQRSSTVVPPVPFSHTLWGFSFIDSITLIPRFVSSENLQWPDPLGTENKCSNKQIASPLIRLALPWLKWRYQTSFVSGSWRELSCFAFEGKQFSSIHKQKWEKSDFIPWEGRSKETEDLKREAEKKEKRKVSPWGMWECHAQQLDYLGLLTSTCPTTTCVISITSLVLPNHQ